MRVVIQRIKNASVTIDNKLHSSIASGVLILIGVEDRDGEEDVDWLVKKVSQLRIFDDENGVMNCSIIDVAGEALVVSQFTLHASTKKGNRPSYIRASRPEHAIPMYELFCRRLSQAIGKEVATGVFGADMQVALVNDGPVTICIDSQNRE
jgi:D-tyrosyl-tRNA(Tyr) deacylase